MNDKDISTSRKLIGGFLFFGGLGLVFGAAWSADGASFEAGIVNLVIGTPLFWPVLKSWLNKVPFSK